MLYIILGVALVIFLGLVVTRDHKKINTGRVNSVNRENGGTDRECNECCPRCFQYGCPCPLKCGCKYGIPNSEENKKCKNDCLKSYNDGSLSMCEKFNCDLSCIGLPPTDPCVD